MNTSDSKTTYLPPISGERFAVVELEGRGEGVVATQDLKPGELIFREQALLKLKGSEVQTDTTQSALDCLTEVQRNLYYRLHNCYIAKEGYSGPAMSEILGIWATNAFDTLEKEQVVMLGAASKFNHSCRPNSSRVWCPETDSWSFVASDYIKEGQEITQAYLDVELPAEARRLQALHNWGFLCECEACLQSPDLIEASDERRSRLRRLRKLMSAQTFADEDQVMEALDLYAAEGLYDHLSEVSCEYVNQCAKRGLDQKVSIWSEIAAKHLTYAMGEDHEEVRFFQRCVEQPWLYREERLAGNKTRVEKC